MSGWRDRVACSPFAVIALRSRALLIAAVLALASGAGLFAQSSVATPPRDTSLRAPGTGEIRGRVVRADTGEPLSGARVEALGNSVQYTDAAGRFTLSLFAGSHLIEVSLGGYVTTRAGQRLGARADRGERIQIASGEVVDGIEVPLVKGGVVSGRVVDGSGAPAVGMVVRLYRAAWVSGEASLAEAPVGWDQTDDRGEFRLFGVPTGTFALAAIPANYGQQIPTFYPGTAEGSLAEMLRIRAGEVVSGLVFSCAATPMVLLSGTVTLPDGTPYSGQLRANRIGMRVQSLRDGSTSVARGGRYEFSLPRGAYALEVETNSVQERLFAHETVILEGSSVSVPLVLQRGYGVRGRYVLEEGGPVQMPARSSRSGFFQPVDAASFSGAGAWTAKTDGSFEVTGVKGRFRVNWPTPSGMTIERVTSAGQDITDQPLDLSTGSLEGVEVVVSSRPHATLTGEVASGNGRTSANVTVMLLPEDRAKVFVSSPYAKNTRPDAKGSFVMRDVRPGKYFLIAVEDLRDAQEASNPALMEVLRANAIVIDVERGETQKTFAPRFRPPAEYLSD
jgi:hypothetical protein